MRPKTPHKKRAAVRLAEDDDHIGLLRQRVTKAVLIWREAKRHAEQAKQRRKLARLFARRAKKDAKQAKANLAEVREALALAEASAMTRRLEMKRRKAMPAKKARSKKRAAVSRGNKQRALKEPSVAIAAKIDTSKAQPSDAPAAPAATLTELEMQRTAL